jgi:hypothetical protein
LLRRVDELAAARVVATEPTRARDAKAWAGLLEDLPAERGSLVDDRDREPSRGRLHPRCQPGRASADHQNVVGGRGRGGGRAAAATYGTCYLQAGIAGSGAPIVD